MFPNSEVATQTRNDGITAYLCDTYVMPETLIV